MKNLTHMVGGVALAASFVTNPAYATHQSCDEIAALIVEHVEQNHPLGTGNSGWTYGGPGEVASEEFSNCVVQKFEEGISLLPEAKKGYTLEVNSEDKRWEYGTTCSIKEIMREFCVQAIEEPV